MKISSEQLLAKARELLPDAVALRRRIHQRPELGLELPETTAAVLEALEELDLEIARSEKSTGVIAILRGEEPGPAILLRADMDALPLPEESGLEFASRVPGRMHACGHDAHTAMLAAAARLLHQHRSQLRGSVVLFFQAGEEGHFGAKCMIDEGLLEGIPELQAAFALHVDPQMSSGKIASRAGPILAAADVFSIQLQGRGGHASMPHYALDPIPVACEIVLALQGFVTRRIDAFDPVVITVTRLSAGTTTNVIPGSAEILGTVRSISELPRKRAHEAVERIAKQVAAAHELEATVHLFRGYPPTLNDPAFADFVREVSVELVGERDFVERKAPTMHAEDFCYLLERMPGAMTILGVREPGMSQPEPLHSSKMRLDEDAMVIGIALHAAVALRYLDKAAA